MGSQSERVCIRASARITPIRNSVEKLAMSRVGSANCANEWATELNPDTSTLPLSWLIRRFEEMSHGVERRRHQDRHVPLPGTQKNAEDEATKECFFD